MPFDIKLVFSIFGALLTLAILSIGKVDHGKTSSWFWKGGKKDPVRTLVARADGSLRSGFKIAWVCLLIVWLLVIWIFG